MSSDEAVPSSSAVVIGWNLQFRILSASVLPAGHSMISQLLQKEPSEK
jgi:hypothetical protein